MKKLKFYQLLFLRFLIIVAICITAWQLYNFGYSYTTLFALFLLVILCAETYLFVKNVFAFYDRTIAAILQQDFSADFSNDKLLNNYESLITLYTKLKNEQHQQQSQDQVYRSLINSIDTGILILRKTDTDWDVFLMNDYFSNYFTTPKVSKWHYLKQHIPSLCNLIEAQDFQEIKTSLDIRVNHEDKQTFIMQSARTKTLYGEYYVTFLDSIQKVIDKKEKDAWVNLMKVISHELLNSITPIRSLSQNLQELVTQENLSDEDLLDMKESVSTMLHRSNHLQMFVESYRKLAMLPSPKKERIAIEELLQNCMEVMTPLLKEHNIILTNDITFNRWLYIDKMQMEQVFINLLTNSMHSLKEAKDKQITIAAEVKKNRTFITISDTGKGVAKEIEDKIFLPFFTTRPDGAGIGLTLSKNIVEAHGGYLVYQQNEIGSRFVVCLLE